MGWFIVYLSSLSFGRFHAELCQVASTKSDLLVGGFAHVLPNVIYFLPMICKPLSFRGHIPLLQLNMRTL